MCFYYDYDWRASVYEEEDGPAPEATRCGECRLRIHKGEWRRHVFMQEHEECQRCIDMPEPEEHPECAEAGHDHGEEFEYDRCRRCHLFLEAVRRREEGEGCSGDETQPPLGELDDSLGNTGERDEYAEFAVAMFPELAFSGHLSHFCDADDPFEDPEAWGWSDADLEPVDELGEAGA